MHYEKKQHIKIRYHIKTFKLIHTSDKKLGFKIILIVIIIIIIKFQKTQREEVTPII